jgi:RimJ/RimL family protein N-acetyltransferase
VQKKYETIEKSMQDENSLFYFAVRAQPQEADAPELLIGFAKLYWFEWTNRNCYVQLGIGDPANWHKGFGADILQLMLHFAFAELNMHRLTGLIPAYNQSALALFTKTGFQEEVCSRQALHRDGQRWDLLHYGLLQREWQAVAA